MPWNNPKTWLPNAVLTAAELNQYVRDNFRAIGDAWTSYTPTWTSSSTQPALGNGTATGRYLQAGKLIVYRSAVAMGTTTTFGAGQYYLSLPVAAHVTGTQLVHGEAVIGSSVYVIRGRILTADTTKAFLYCSPTTAGAADRAVSPTTPGSFANGSQIIVTGIYEAA
ncbi:hypothetical protein [Pimelobacter simplex]|uniref:hypothetical protein n=1 Tax=Nocardioides simplex TaxID=2045 RepID=UPI0021506B18|nr:hypothetical protein [Pimelobacter simplex]UUW87394.1 hypothetical protein M0M43_16765 [Pimelobacter simplex]UUW96899.1 hypothetical protein M0M48_05410 [Pimelobacter simplex]